MGGQEFIPFIRDAKLEKDTSLAEEAARHWAQVEAATIPLALLLPHP